MKIHSFEENFYTDDKLLAIIYHKSLGLEYNMSMRGISMKKLPKVSDLILMFHEWFIFLSSIKTSMRIRIWWWEILLRKLRFFVCIVSVHVQWLMHKINYISAIRVWKYNHWREYYYKVTGWYMDVAGFANCWDEFSKQTLHVSFLLEAILYLNFGHPHAPNYTLWYTTRENKGSTTSRSRLEL